jgi:cob(I)alamin adenosyltransferase
MAVYTKRGDKGQTSLYDGKNVQDKRVSKNSLVINAIGSVDEANSYIGVVRSETEKEIDIEKHLIQIQSDLFTIGSILAGAESDSAGAKLELRRDRVTEIEKEIDEMEETLPVLTGFILPGGRLSSHLHFARSLVRRAERSLVELSESSNTHFPLTDILVYVNRLSDYLFMLARKVNFEAKIEEKKWER